MDLMRNLIIGSLEHGIHVTRNNVTCIVEEGLEERLADKEHPFKYKRYKRSRNLKRELRKKYKKL